MWIHCGKGEKMHIKKDWQKRFGEAIKKEIANYAKEGATQDERWILVGIKDTLYLLGEAINKEEYSYANGFLKFCEELGVDLKR